MYLGTMWWIVLVIFATAVVISAITFLCQWGGCCVQRTDHTGSHLQVRLGWGYAFDMHSGRRVIEDSRQQRHEAAQRALAARPRGLPIPVLSRLHSFTFTSTDKHASEDVDCTICQEDLCQHKVASLPCGHMFHNSCIKMWLKRRATCPTCRLEITAKMLECGDVVDAAPEAEAIADIEAGLSTCAPQPTQQRRAAHRSHNASHVSATPADEPQNAQALRAPSIQSLTVPQDSASCLPQQRHVVQQQTIV